MYTAVTEADRAGRELGGSRWPRPPHSLGKIQPWYRGVGGGRDGTCCFFDVRVNLVLGRGRGGKGRHGVCQNPRSTPSSVLVCSRLHTYSSRLFARASACCVHLLFMCVCCLLFCTAGGSGGSRRCDSKNGAEGRGGRGLLCAASWWDGCDFFLCLVRGGRRV